MDTSKNLPDRGAWEADKNANLLLELVEGIQDHGIKKDVDIAFAHEYIEEAKEIARNYGRFQGLSLGYSSLDNLTGSFLPGELFVIGGGTGHGKSLFAQNIAYKVYKQTGSAVLFVTLEMTKEQTLSRVLKIAGDDDVAGILFQKQSSVEPRDIPVLMSKAKEWDCILVVIDHLHFFPRTSDKVRNEISRITKLFKESAVEHKLPVILLSHINRTLEKGEKPDLQHLKESGSIEQDADMVGFVYRDKKETPDTMEFYMRKNRSRKLIYDSIFFRQNVWNLEEVHE